MSNRVIKFRAWDEDRQLMIYEFAEKGWSKKSYRLIFNDEGGIFCGNYMDNGDWQEPKLMQFTGLHDKEGKEIYEGDVILWEIYKYIVKWHDDNACFYLEPVVSEGDCTDFSEIPPTHVSVIGNVHQHKHLIE